MDIFYKLLLVFLAGGFFSLIAQLLIDLTRLTPARILVLYVSLGVLLYAVGIYEPMFEIFGTGVSVPLVGFGANIGRGIKEAVESEGLLGALSGGLSSSSVGITSALLLGLLLSLFSKSKSKRM